MKRFIAIFAGLATAFITFMLFELISSKIFPFPVNLNPADPVAMKSYVAGLSTSALLLIVAGYLTGSFLAGMVIKLVSQSENRKPALLTGIFLTVGGLINFMTIHHPVWMVVVSTAAYIPMVLAGFSIVKTKQRWTAK